MRKGGTSRRAYSANWNFRFPWALSIPFVLFFSASTLADQSPVQITVQLKWQHCAQFAGYYAADQMGFYRESGISASFLPAGFDTDLQKPVLDGSAQFGIDSASNIVLASGHGHRIRAVAEIFRRNPLVFISRAEKGFKRPADLKNTTIRINRVSSLDAALMLSGFGLSEQDYSRVDLDSDIARIFNDKPDVWLTYLINMVAKADRAGIPVNRIYPDDYGVHIPGDTLYARSDYIDENPDVVSNFVRATIKGWRYVMAHLNEVGPMIQAYRPDADITAEIQNMKWMLPLLHTGDGRVGWIDVETWDEIGRSLHALGYLQRWPVTTEFVEARFVEQIYAKN